CFHALWFGRMDPSAAKVLADSPALSAWFARVEAMGHGSPTPMDAAEALAIAAAASPATARQEDADDPNGLRTGARVTVTPDDYALDPVAGELVSLSASDVAI